MEHLVDLETRQIVFTSTERIVDFSKLEKNIDAYKWCNASPKLIQPVFDGEYIVEGKTLPQLKIDTYKKIDAKTKEIIARGFSFNCGFKSGINTFSLSLEAQSSIAALIQANSLGILNDKQIKLNTIDDSATVVIPADKILDFCLTAFGAVEESKSAGTALKEQVRAMTDFWAVAGFKDERK